MGGARGGEKQSCVLSESQLHPLATGLGACQNPALVCSLLVRLSKLHFNASREGLGDGRAEQTAPCAAREVLGRLSRATGGDGNAERGSGKGGGEGLGEGGDGRKMGKKERQGPHGGRDAGCQLPRRGARRLPALAPLRALTGVKPTDRDCWRWTELEKGCWQGVSLPPSRLHGWLRSQAQPAASDRAQLGFAAAS